MIVNQHFRATRNVGDLASAPALYFPDLGATVADTGEPLPAETRAVIFGGGALGQRLLRQGDFWAGDSRITIAWGVGTSIRGERDPDRPADWLTLYGSREWGWQSPWAEWAPCASCMAREFDRVPEPAYDAVLYFNARRGAPEIDGIPRSDNEQSFAAAVAFLASGMTVVTNSYHGAYWALLMGRKVVIVGAYSSKFYGFRWPPEYAEAVDWRAAAAKARVYPGALDAARAATIAFADRVRDLLAVGGGS